MTAAGDGSGRRTAFGVIGGIIVLSAPMIFAALAATRESARQARCGKAVNQLAIAQQNIATSG